MKPENKSVSWKNLRSFEAFFSPLNSPKARISRSLGASTLPRVRRLLAMAKSAITRKSWVSSARVRLSLTSLLVEKKKNTHTNTLSGQIHTSGRHVVRWGAEGSAAQGAGLRTSPGQTGVGRRREPHGANGGAWVLLLLVVLRQLPVEGDGFCCKLGQVFGAAVPAGGDDSTSV